MSQYDRVSVRMPPTIELRRSRIASVEVRHLLQVRQGSPEGCDGPVPQVSSTIRTGHKFTANLMIDVMQVAWCGLERCEEKSPHLTSSVQHKSSVHPTQTHMSSSPWHFWVAPAASCRNKDVLKVQKVVRERNVQTKYVPKALRVRFRDSLGYWHQNEEIMKNARQ